MTLAPPIRFAIPDLQTGCEIIARFPLTNPSQASIDLNGFLDCLLALPPDAETYFRLLEHARVSAAFINEELAKRYLSKPLPLGDIEEAVFQTVIGTWQKAARAYAHCAQLVTPEDTREHALRVATLLQRCLHYTGMAIVEYQRARREYAWGLWLDLHGYYASAEEWGLATFGVPDTLDAPDTGTHCMATYAAFLLCEMAGGFSLSVKKQALVRRWAKLWAPLVTVAQIDPEVPPTGFVIDLMQDCALRPVSHFVPGPNLRRLDTTRLSAQLAHVRELIRQRVPPAQLALGEDCSAGQCAQLLDALARPWALAPASRKFRRRASSGTVRVCSGFEEMYFFITGRAFEQPENVRTYSRQEFETLFAFRHQENPQQTLQVQREQLDYRLDEWEIVNQSAQGFRLIRSVSGRKMAHGQLIALCPPDGEQFFLAQTSWLMQEREGGLIAGVDALPGMPQPIAARTRDADGSPPGKYQPAFLLPAIPSVQGEQSLVLPVGWYRPGRVVELYTDRAWQVRLLQVLDDGSDFERTAFVIC